MRFILPDVFFLKNTTNTREVYSTMFHELAHASHYSKAGSPYWGSYIAGILGNTFTIGVGTYGNGTGLFDGHIGVGEMWGYYFGYAAMKHHFESATWYSSYNAYWFKPQILKELKEDYGFTEAQIFNCLTPDVNNHTKLKNRLIQNYGQAAIINQVFSDNGF